MMWDNSATGFQPYNIAVIYSEEIDQCHHKFFINNMTFLYIKEADSI